MQKTISVLICALNEESNIGNILQDILSQEYPLDFHTNFEIENIVVVSDGSTDNTEKIVQDFAGKNSKIKLLKNETRMGKVKAMTKGFEFVSSDYGITFDADVRLEKNTIQNLTKAVTGQDYMLVAGNPVPEVNPGMLDIAQQASMFSWIGLQEIKKIKPLSIYSAHGRILMSNKELYKNIDFDKLSTPGDDAYMYIKANHNFFYAKDAVVKYAVPGTISDYIKQNVRFRKSMQMKVQMNVDRAVVAKEYFIPNKIWISLYTLFKYPYKAFCWMTLFVIGFIKYKLFIEKSTDMKKIWAEVKSTK